MSTPTSPDRPYAGDLTPQQAWDLLEADPRRRPRRRAHRRRVALDRRPRPVAARRRPELVFTEWVHGLSARATRVPRRAREGRPAPRRRPPGRLPVPLRQPLDRRGAPSPRRPASAPSYNVLEGFEGDARPRRPPRPATAGALRGPALDAESLTERPGRARSDRDPDGPAAARSPAPSAPRPLAVRGGHVRSEFEETSEPIFLTQGYVYDRAADAEAAFTGETDRFIYSRYGNPTVHDVRGAPAPARRAPRPATRRRPACPRSSPRSPRSCSPGRRIVAARALFGSTRRDLRRDLRRSGASRTDYVDGHEPEQWEAALADARPTSSSSRRRPTRCRTSSTSQRVSELAHAAGRRRRPRQRVRDAGAAEARSSSAPTSSCTRRPSTSTGRGACSAARSSAPTRVHRRARADVHPQHRAVAQRRSTRGCCSRGWRRCRCASRAQSRRGARRRAMARGRCPAIARGALPVPAVAPAARARAARR